MAIKRNTSTPAASLPPDFTAHCRKAFSLQQISGIYKDGYDAERKWLVEYLEHNTAGVTIEAGKALKVAEGQLVFKTTTRYEIDKTKLEALIKSGEISLATVLAIASFSGEKLLTALGQGRFNAIAEAKESEALALTATADFKREVEETFSTRTLIPDPPIPTFPDAIEAASVEPAPKFTRKSKSNVVFDHGEPPATGKLTSLEKAKAAAAKAKGSKDVKSDLDDILGGK